MKRKKRKIRKLITILIAILIVLLIIIAVFLIKEKNENYKVEYNKMKAETYAQMSQTMYFPNGIHQLNSEYDGNVDLDEFYESIYDFYHIIMEMSELKEKKVEKYYENNLNRIKEVMNITSLEEFKTIVNYVSQYGALETFSSATIDTESFNSQSRFLCFKMNFAFDTTKVLNFDVMLRRYKSSNVAYFDIAK